jgi:hypothetical protein
MDSWNVGDDVGKRRKVRQHSIDGGWVIEGSAMPIVDLVTFNSRSYGPVILSGDSAGRFEIVKIEANGTIAHNVTTGAPIYAVSRIGTNVAYTVVSKPFTKTCILLDQRLSTLPLRPKKLHGEAFPPCVAAAESPSSSSLDLYLSSPLLPGYFENREMPFGLSRRWGLSALLLPWSVQGPPPI